jgi:hypothetical protein
MASTGTGSLGKIPVSQLKGAVLMPQAMSRISNKNVTSLFSRKNLINRCNISAKNIEQQ